MPEWRILLGDDALDFLRDRLHPMCGIAGYIMRDGARLDPRELEYMVDALAHRGPDDRGIHTNGPVGLAQVRLSIIGLATGHQPMVSESRQLALVANGEVYNYVELNALLRKEGCFPRTESDSETILNAYAVQGPDFLSELRGMYAFALDDTKQEHTILARDRLGIKPLFYVRLPDRIGLPPRSRRSSGSCRDARSWCRRRCDSFSRTNSAEARIPFFRVSNGFCRDRR